MFAYELEVGDVFKVDKPDPESPVRILLEKKPSLKFGFPNMPDFWCGMGILCKVSLIERKAQNG